MDSYITTEIIRQPVPLLTTMFLVPGVLGSQLQAKLHRKHSAWWLCSKTSDWFDIWLNIRELTPLSIDCWVDDIKYVNYLLLDFWNVTRFSFQLSYRLLFNNKTGGIQNQEGVEIRTTHFGSTEAFEYLDKDEYAPGN